MTAANSLERLLLCCPALPAQGTGGGTVAALTCLHDWGPPVERVRTETGSPGTREPRAHPQGTRGQGQLGQQGGPVSAKADP